jgi:hypothetical protein
MAQESILANLQRLGEEVRPRVSAPARATG